MHARVPALPEVEYPPIRAIQIEVDEASVRVEMPQLEHGIIGKQV